MTWEPAGPAWLFCPADRPERYGKAAAAADVVIIELGIPDGVPSDFHYKPSTLTDLARACPETTFLATHLFTESVPESAGEVPSLPRNVIQVADGDRFLLEKSGTTRISN